MGWGISPRLADREDRTLRILGVLVAAWIIIGFFAGLQRNYYSGSVSCARAGTIAATVAAGPLNYVGANPKVHCTVPQPSR
jgi:hypothetical protein